MKSKKLLLAYIFILTNESKTMSIENNHRESNQRENNNKINKKIIVMTITFITGMFTTVIMYFGISFLWQTKRHINIDDINKNTKKLKIGHMKTIRIAANVTNNFHIILCSEDKDLDDNDRKKKNFLIEESRKQYEINKKRNTNEILYQLEIIELLFLKDQNYQNYEKEMLKIYDNIYDNEDFKDNMRFSQYFSESIKEVSWNEEETRFFNLPILDRTSNKTIMEPYYITTFNKIKNSIADRIAEYKNKVDFYKDTKDQNKTLSEYISLIFKIHFSKSNNKESAKEITKRFKWFFTKQKNINETEQNTRCSEKDTIYFLLRICFLEKKIKELEKTNENNNEIEDLKSQQKKIINSVFFSSAEKDLLLNNEKNHIIDNLLESLESSHSNKDI